ncbi:MAG: HD-GYP domain-containing protein, partial [Pseudomonadota bacterium]|nr:HD-GYP domain-containing protein [Pseudomonadota bacterium]
NRYDHLLADPNNLEPEKIQQAFKEFRSARIYNKLGSFVFVGVYNAQGKVITEIFDQQQKSLGQLKKKQQKMKIKIPGDGNERYEIIRVAGLPFLRIALPLVNGNRKRVGIINGFFAFSPETIDAFRMRGLRAMASAMLIVLLTTAMLYPVILRLTRRITRFSVQLLDANLETLETLGNAIAQRDSDTNAHNYRVCIYAVHIGEELGLPNQTMRTLIKGSFLHDVGKIGIPDEILLKPGKLDDQEFAIMKTHVEQGREIIQRSQWLHDALEVVTSHHEKMAGKGYPKRLSGESIPVTARIFAIADVFDALTSKRPYKEAFSFEEAMKIMKEENGSHFDPYLFDIFSRIAKPLYERFGGKEEIFREELHEIITKYFHEGMDCLEY